MIDRDASQAKPYVEFLTMRRCFHASVGREHSLPRGSTCALLAFGAFFACVLPGGCSSIAEKSRRSINGPSMIAERFGLLALALSDDSLVSSTASHLVRYLGDNDPPHTATGRSIELRPSELLKLVVEAVEKRPLETGVDDEQPLALVVQTNYGFRVVTYPCQVKPGHRFGRRGNRSYREEWTKFEIIIEPKLDERPVNEKIGLRSVEPAIELDGARDDRNRIPRIMESMKGNIDKLKIQLRGLNGIDEKDEESKAMQAEIENLERTLQSLKVTLDRREKTIDGLKDIQSWIQVKVSGEWRIPTSVDLVEHNCPHADQRSSALLKVIVDHARKKPNENRNSPGNT